MRLPRLPVRPRALQEMFKSPLLAPLAEGTAAFKAGDLPLAIRKWHESMLWVKGLNRPAGMMMPEGDGGQKQATDDEKSEINAFIVACHLNVAAAQIKARRTGATPTRAVSQPPLMNAVCCLSYA